MSYIAIVDYGAGNLMSVHNTLDYLGYENRIADTPALIEQAAGVILPARLHCSHNGWAAI